MISILFSQFYSCIFLITGSIAQKEAEKSISAKNGAFPENFMENKSTLVVITGDNKSYNKYLVKDFKKYYSGACVFIKSIDFADSKYDDKDKYRYIFDYDLETHYYRSSELELPAEFRNNIRGSSVTVRRFYLIDRKEDQFYQSSVTSSYFSKVIKVYAQKLNQQMIENQK